MYEDPLYYVHKRDIDNLIWLATFGDAVEKPINQWLIWELAQYEGVRPWSIHDLYMARGRGEVPPTFTVPAMNLRALTYDTARAVFRAALKLNAGAMIFEIARSEIGYTSQRPAEYVSAVLAAAIKEGYQGPLFIQGDHFQVNGKKYQAGGAERDKELKAVRDLTAEAVAAGFYNIDVDSSTLVNLKWPSVAEQQRENFEQCAQLTRFTRGVEPGKLTVSVGGEIGEVGKKNSTEEELRAFMDGYLAAARGVWGISKISIQTGTSHGGVMMPDGKLKDVAIDFDTLARLSKVAREEYHLAGAVQHGASTLPAEAFGKFVECGACEVHLATEFQNMMFESPAFPKALKQEMYAWLDVNAADERAPGETPDQFYYKTRKKALGPFKQELWKLTPDVDERICSALQAKFEFLFERLGIVNTYDVVMRTVKTEEIHKEKPAGAGAALAAEDVKGLAD
ncbi:MAG: class II fructose-bisphosphate aldolase [Chloroflexi bacterium]|nr:class II fructose-bisphosphate aldolase [Chloroflexota bacterium]